MDLNEEQLERYSRHIILTDVGPEGQEKIMNGKVLIIGAGNTAMDCCRTSKRRLELCAFKMFRQLKPLTLVI